MLVLDVGICYCDELLPLALRSLNSCLQFKVVNHQLALHVVHMKSFLMASRQNHFVQKLSRASWDIVLTLTAAIVTLVSTASFVRVSSSN